MPTYKLTYFDAAGLAEPIRWILSYMNAKFEEVRFGREEWPKFKPATPFGKVPVLEIDGKKIHQSACICRYLAKQAGLAGDNDWENIQIDMIVDTMGDLRGEFSKYITESDEDSKQKKKEVLLNETIPFYFNKFDDIIKKDGYLANGKLSWGDIYIICVIDAVSKYMNESLLDKYTNFKKLNEKVTNIPSIKEWISKRPKGQF